MTGPNDSTGRVLELRRPPVRQATMVRSSVTHTFEVFVREVGAWWPVQSFSAGQHQVRAVTIERQPDGRVYETWQDGSTIDWGRITTWQPPERFAMTWTMTPAVTHVELTFTALSPVLTRVAVEHRGWDSLTDQQLAEDCALPGGYTSGGYTTGWARILTALAAAAEASTPSPATDPTPDPPGRTTS